MKYWPLRGGRDPIVPGEEGLKDIRIVRAIMESSEKTRRASDFEEKKGERFDDP